MRPSLATVISPRPWERRLVDCAVETGLVRMVARCYDPDDIPSGVEMIVVGTETPWLDVEVILKWRTARAAVIGIFPALDRAAVALLCRAKVDQLFVETVDPVLILRAARDIALQQASNASGSTGDPVARRRVPTRRGPASAAGD